MQRRADRINVARSRFMPLIRCAFDDPKVRSEKLQACAAFPLLIELLANQAQQTFVALLPVLRQLGEVVYGIHHVCQAVTLVGGKSATMTIVANEPRVNRCVFQYFETRRQIRFWSERHGTQRCNPDAVADQLGYRSQMSTVKTRIMYIQTRPRAWSDRSRSLVEGSPHIFYGDARVVPLARRPRQARDAVTRASMLQKGGTLVAQKGLVRALHSHVWQRRLWRRRDPKQPVQLSLSYSIADLDDILPPASYKLDSLIAPACRSA